MRIHHLNCGTFCPAGGALMDGVSKGPRGRLVCHCWLLELGDQLVLVDTGLGLGDVHDPVPRLSPLYMGLLGVQLREEETAVRQVERLGFSAADVRHIVLTHMDFDHAGGLEDFPNATVHLMAKEAAAAQAREGFVGRRRYRPQQWDEVGKWETYEPRGERWFGFGAVRELKGLPPEILMVPLRGHTLGHAGVAVQGPSGWLLHAGDAYFYREEVRRADRRCTPGLRAYQKLMEVDRPARLMNQQRLRELSVRGRGEVIVMCAHDHVEFDRACAAQGSLR